MIDKPYRDNMVKRPETMKRNSGSPAEETVAPLRTSVGEPSLEKENENVRERSR
jgi:hypothetical protein